jgi:hypothetical protein
MGMEIINYLLLQLSKTQSKSLLVLFNFVFDQQSFCFPKIAIRKNE